MSNEATFREILLPSSGTMIGPDDGRSISRNVASLNILVHDVINLLYYKSELLLDKKCPSNNKKHSNYVSRKNPKSVPSCNCRKKDDCLVNSNCLINNVIYKCTVSPTTTTNNEHISDLSKVCGNSDIRTMRNLLETQDIRTIQHFLVIYRNWRRKQVKYRN